MQLARREWEARTSRHTKFRPIGGDNTREHPFRRFGQAIAWLKWDAADRIEIAKFETLQPNQGAAGRLIEFLKSLADKYQLRLWGQARIYLPDPPVPQGRLLNREELENFYRKHGFQLRQIDADTSEMCYLPRQANSLPAK